MPPNNNKLLLELIFNDIFVWHVGSDTVRYARQYDGPGYDFINMLRGAPKDSTTKDYEELRKLVRDEILSSLAEGENGNGNVENGNHRA